MTLDQKQIVASIEQVFLDQTAKDSPLANQMLRLFPREKISWVEKRPWEEGTLSAKEFDRSKRNLFITPFKGHFFKRCPGAKPGLTCCNYFVLNLGLQCNMNCSYCYLQSFINSPVMTAYSNVDTALKELAGLKEDLLNQKIRVGTGEVIDSLSLDPLTLISRQLIEFFRDVPQWTLEFKTKSAFVDQFLDCKHAGNVLVSWSINPQHIVEREEHGTASVDERLQAALKCVDHGFPIAFHLDPMIWHPGWQEHYGTLIDRICSLFTPSQIQTISLGALRFQPEQRSMMRERFGLASYVTQGEMFPGPDGKMRYAQELRAEMLEFALKRFRGHSPLFRVFLCMETPETWMNTFEQPAHKVEALDSLFDPKVVRQWKQQRSTWLQRQIDTSSHGAKTPSAN